MEYASLPRTMARWWLYAFQGVEGSSAFHVVEDEVVWDCCAFIVVGGSVGDVDAL
jgi:hypothetical protein